MPTQTTRSAGTVALVSAALWVIAAVLSLLGAGGKWELKYALFSAAVLVAAATFTFVVAGALLRSGGIRGWWPGITLATSLFSVLCALVVTWAWPLWAAPLTVAALLTVIRLRSAELSLGATRGPMDWVFVAAWPIGFATFVLLDALKVGSVDEYGDRFVANRVGFGLGTLIFAAGLVRFGRWLRSEHPAEIIDAINP